jgi:hypothetical protein
VFLIGSFSASNLLFAKLQNHFKNDGNLTISRPNSHTYARIEFEIFPPTDHFHNRKKAVADGALSYYIDHFIPTRISKFTYGVSCSKPYQPGTTEHEQRISDKYQNADGRFFVGGCFETILPVVRVCYLIGSTI